MKSGQRPSRVDSGSQERTAPEDELRTRLERLIAELAGLSYEEDFERFDDIVAELVNYGDVVRPRLAELADSLAYQERRAAVEALGRLGFPERRPIIIARLQDANWKVRRSAALAVSCAPFDEAMPPLLELLDDSHRELRLTVIDALGQLAATDAAPDLERLLQDGDWRIRQDAAVALGRIAAPRSFAPVLTRLTDDDEDVRHAAAAALKQLTDVVPPAAVSEVLADLAERDRKAILAALEKDPLAAELQPLIDELRQFISVAVDIDELSHFGRVMTAPDQISDLERAYERDKEVDDVLQVLLKEGSSSVILVGEAGSGKTAVISELARRAAALDPPWNVLETSTPELMVGTKYIGEWETKLRDLVEKVKGPRRVFLYVTNVNDLPGAGTTSSSKQNFASLLSPYMRRGEVRVIGESTIEALRNGIEKDLSIKRLFTTVNIDEPDRATVVAILEALLADLSEQHQVRLSMSSEVLDLLIELSGTYYSTMAQPGRSVTVLKQVVDHMLEGRADDAPTKIRIQADDIIRGLARFTGLPELLLNDAMPLSPEDVRDFFTTRILGQETAVEAIVDLITLIKAGLNDPTKPFGVFLFVGPTGVGKTEIAKALAEYIFGSPDRLLRFDLSEFKDYHSFEKLIGGSHRDKEKGQLTSKVQEQPFSVILLDEIEKAHPNIFDLFLQVFDDGRLTDGRGRTADFRHTIIVMTSNIASAMSAHGAMGFGEDDSRGLASHEGVLKQVRRFFRPEFLNRVDQTVVFAPLEGEVMRRIALRELGRVLLRSGILRRRLVVDIDDSVIDHLMGLGFSKALGARPLKRAVESQVLLPVAREIVAQGPGYRGDILHVVARDGTVAIERNQSAVSRALAAIREQGTTAVKDSELADLAKRPRSRKGARALLAKASRWLEVWRKNPSLATLETEIAACEARVATVSFWDDPRQARTHLLALARLKLIHDNLTGAAAQARELSEGIDDTPLKVWLDQYHDWLLDLRVLIELSATTAVTA